MKTMEEYLDEIADMEVGCLSIVVKGNTPVFDMEHACFSAGYLVGLAQSRLGNTETLQ